MVMMNVMNGFSFRELIGANADVPPPRPDNFNPVISPNH
jgi:hypothetical protein